MQLPLYTIIRHIVEKIKVIKHVSNMFRFGIENRAVVLRVTSVAIPAAVL